MTNPIRLGREGREAKIVYKVICQENPRGECWESLAFDSLECALSWQPLHGIALRVDARLVWADTGKPCEWEV